MKKILYVASAVAILTFGSFNLYQFLDKRYVLPWNSDASRIANNEEAASKRVNAGNEASLFFKNLNTDEVRLYETLELDACRYGDGGTFKASDNFKERCSLVTTQVIGFSQSGFFDTLNKALAQRSFELDDRITNTDEGILDKISSTCRITNASQNNDCQRIFTESLGSPKHSTSSLLTYQSNKVGSTELLVMMTSSQLEQRFDEQDKYELLRDMYYYTEADDYTQEVVDNFEIERINTALDKIKTEDNSFAIVLTHIHHYYEQLP